MSKKEKEELGLSLVVTDLEKSGYILIEKNLRLPQIAEIDLLFKREGGLSQLFVVEVKSHFFLGSGFEEVISEKQRLRLLQSSFKLKSHYRCSKINFVLAHVNVKSSKVSYYPIENDIEL